MRLAKVFAMAALAALVTAAPAWGQDGRPDRANRRARQIPELAPEKAQAAWEWQAQEVAGSMSLNEMQTKQLVRNYTASRKALADAIRKMRDEARPNRGEHDRGMGDGDRARDRAGQDGERGARDGDRAGRDGDRPGRGRGVGRPGRDGERGGRGGERGGAFGMYREMVDKERDILGGTLEMILPAEQAKEAMMSLGSFSRQWDQMVDTVVGFKLDTEKTYAALAPIRTYVATTHEARRGGGGDRESMRQAMRGAREQLDSDLGNVLTTEQVAKLQPRRGRRGGGEAGGRPEAGDERGRRGRGEGRSTGGSSAKAKVGQPAPDFTVTDSAGTSHTLSAYQGRIVVLQWINPDCPICRRVSETGRVTAMMGEVRETAPDVVHLAVNSTHYMEPADGAKYLARHKIDAPVLVDRDGTLGRMYGAKTTPHLFVIDTEGVLRYQGAIDDDSRGHKGDAAVNYVVQAVRQINAGETVAPDSTKSYGCSVKYKR